MNISFGVKYWALFLLLVIVVSLLITFLSYFRNKNNRDFTGNQLYLLGALRFTSFFMLSFMLLSPLIRSVRKIVQKPLVLIAHDNSQSMITRADSVKTVSALSLISDKIREKTGNTYEVINYTFGEQTEKNGKITLGEKKSDYGEMINSLYNNHFNDNVGALIIAGDGNFNKGENPVNAAGKIGFPVYTIGFGDTTITRDARISNLIVSKSVFSGNYFPVEADLRFLKLKGIPLKFSVFEENEIVYSEQIIPPDNDFFKTVSVILEAKEAGLRHFTLRVEPHPDEMNSENNTSGFVISVLSNKQKIAIVSAGPHPDAGAIRNVLDARKNYEVSLFTQEPYPAEYKNFNLIILNQVPGKVFTAGELIKKVLDSGVPILFVLGNNSFLPQFNQLETGIEINQQVGTNDESQAVVNPVFANFSMSEELNRNISRFPPLMVPFAEYDTDPRLSVVMFQKIKNLATNRPLFAVGSLTGKKTGFIVGEGIWRWRLYDYYFNGTHELFDEFINQFIQYLALKENEDNFNLYFQNIYSETENVIISAELFNDAFERVTNSDVYIDITRDDGTTLKLGFDKLEQTYRLNAGILPVGDYSFSASVQIGEKKSTETGNFAVVRLNGESTENEADFKILNQLAIQSGGKFYPSGSIDNLISDLSGDSSIKPVNYYQTVLNEILNLKLLFFLAAFLLCLEWFLRKFWGVY